MINFYKFPECTPPIGKPILVKFKTFWDETNQYYMLRYIEDWRNKGEYIFEEAGGEQYFTVDKTDVIGWIDTDMLDEISVVVDMPEE